MYRVQVRLKMTECLLDQTIPHQKIGKGKAIWGKQSRKGKLDKSFEREITRLAEERKAETEKERKKY